jgi:hypothetical protein
MDQESSSRKREVEVGRKVNDTAQVWCGYCSPFAKVKYSNVKRPHQTLNEYPQPSDCRDGNGSEIDKFQNEGAHSLTLKPADHPVAFLLPIEFAEYPGATLILRHSVR